MTPAGCPGLEMPSAGHLVTLSWLLVPLTPVVRPFAVAPAAGRRGEASSAGGGAGTSRAGTIPNRGSLGSPDNRETRALEARFRQGLGGERLSSAGDKAPRRGPGPSRGIGACALGFP